MPFRRGIPRRGPIPSLASRAEIDKLRAQYRYGAQALDHVQPGARKS
jgi:hypothetical protein